MEEVTAMGGEEFHRNMENTSVEVELALRSDANDVAQ
jgi:hypothetical protein